jgi:hypothetical protein
VLGAVLYKPHLTYSSYPPDKVDYISVLTFAHENLEAQSDSVTYLGSHSHCVK